MVRKFGTSTVDDLFTWKWLGYSPFQFRETVKQAGFELGEIVRAPRPIEVTVSMPLLDGRLGRVAQAGPTSVYRDNTIQMGLSASIRSGILQFDRWDYWSSRRAHLDCQIVKHELLHVLGFGTIDRWYDSLTRGGSYIGNRGVDVWRNEMGQTGFPPLESTGGRGTAGAHWSEHRFGNEIGTGYLSSTNKLSRLTLAALIDLGYDVDLDEADSYVLPTSAAGVHLSLASDHGFGVHRCGVGHVIDPDEDIRRFDPLAESG